MDSAIDWKEKQLTKRVKFQSELTELKARDTSCPKGKKVELKIIRTILLMFVKQIFEDFENLENKKESNLNKTCCCRPAVNSYNESGQIYLYNSIARA